MTQSKTIADASSTLAGSTILRKVKMKLNRRRLRRLIKEEYNKVLEEMYGGYMGGGHTGMGPNHPEYDLCGNAIQAATMDCIRRGVRSSDPVGVQGCCMTACINHNVKHHFDYVCEKVMGMLQMSGL